MKVKLINKAKKTCAFKLFLYAILCTALFYSCTPPEPFPNEPHITFDDLTFYEVDTNGEYDSLVLKMSFEDGDGDLGLADYEQSFPYHDYAIIIDSLHYQIETDPISKKTYNVPYFKFVTLGRSILYPPFYYYYPYSDFYYKNEQLFYPQGIIPSSSFAAEDPRTFYSCLDYDTLRTVKIDRKNLFIPHTFKLNLENKLDTVFVIKNEFRSNITIDFYIERTPGNFELLDWKYLTSEYGCGLDFNGRFPILDEKLDGTSLQGQIKYTMKSQGFLVTLRNNRFKLSIKIIDRSLNVSNILETPAVTLNEINPKFRGD